MNVYKFIKKQVPKPPVSEWLEADFVKLEVRFFKLFIMLLIAFNLSQYLTVIPRANLLIQI